MTEDRILIRKFKCGSGEALQRIYTKYKNDLLKLAITLANDVSMAEDVVQDVFVAFAQTNSRIRPAGDLRKYLVTCVANRIRNHRRDQQRHGASDIENATGVPTDSRGPEQWAMLNEELLWLSEALGHVPYQQREVLMLYMEGHMTFRQIAAMQNVSISTVQGRYRYGMTRLRSLLDGKFKHEANE
jgi:RNA polymerase sigma-70 factor, ECF subfamily